jgi:ABC-type nitrate/sulfonate/bicarbonate transport system substrate-binding protein
VTVVVPDGADDRESVISADDSMFEAVMDEDKKDRRRHPMCKTFLTFMFVAALAGCQKSSTQNNEHPSATPLQKVTVAFTCQPQSTLVHVALAKGYFIEEGLDVKAQMHTYGKAALKSMVENNADFATAAETPIMFSVLAGDGIFVIANIEASSTNNAIVARKSAGIAAPGDLKGKRIAFTPGTTSDFFLDSILTANGLTRKDIRPVALKPEEMQDAVMAMKVDAVSVWNYPLTQIKQQLGPEGTIFYDREIYTETFNVAARQDFVKNNPKAVEHFLRALIKAENFVVKNPGEAQAIMFAATKVDKWLIREVWTAFNYHVKLDQTLLIALEDETRWAIRNKLTDRTEMPEYQTFIHLDSLRAVKPEAVKTSR